EQNNLSLKKYYFEAFIIRLEEWKQINLVESPLWNHYYFPFFDLWEKEAQLKLEEIKTQLNIEEPITANIYREGEALQPDDAVDKQLFLGRQQLKDELATKILTARTIPLFLVQGQRRVGKTSLLKFLPRILDPSVFKVVQQDLQGVGHEPIRWMVDLRQQINHCLGIEETSDWQPTGKWMDVWSALQAYMEGLALGENVRLILAFDEYESLHRAFSKDVEQAEQLLGAMRSFSQHQNRIVFLFIGAAFLSDLKDPNWSRFFVHAETLRVHFLNEADSLQLITRPIPEFNIKYHPSIPPRIYELTQGHPALLQSICRQLVALANQNNNPNLQPEQLEQVLNEKILDFEYKPIAIFWEEEFCHPEYHPHAQQTVLEVIQQQPITHRAELKRMLRHRYVLKVTEEGAEYRYRMAVPLFEMWVRRHGLEDF
ncbi:MAG: hypothetical protein ACPGVB_03655, partial [Chitinophagales bacterium]